MEQEAASSNSPLSESGKVRVLKFGGSSLRDADRIHAVAGLVTRALSETIPVVVVSAVGGTTNALVEIAEMAGRGDVEYEDRIQRVEDRHREILDRVAAEREAKELRARLDEYFQEIRNLAKGARFQERTPLDVGFQIVELRIAAHRISICSPGQHR